MENNFRILLSALACVLLASCGKSVLDLPGTEEESGKTTRVVTLQCNEEQVNVTETSVTPMTRGMSARTDNAGGNAVYGVNIFVMKEGSYTPYAYGLFTDPTTMSVIMTEGENYKIECTLVRDGEDTLYHEGNTYKAPFLSGAAGGSTDVTNRFVYSETTNLTGIAAGESNTDATTTTKYLRAYRFYGTMLNFDPATTDKVALKLKRAVFGIHFVMNPPKEGTATIKFLNDKYITIGAGDEPYDHESVYTFNQVAKSCDEDYHGKIELFTTWHHIDGRDETAKYMLPVERNMTSTVQIDFSGPKNMTFSIEEESTPMRDSIYNWTIKSN